MKKWIALILAAAMAINAYPQTGKRKTDTKQKTEMKTIQITAEEFKKKIADYEAADWTYLGDKPALVDFYADWCGPCKSIAPILEELAAEYDGQIYIYKVNTDKEQALSAAFGIRSIPSLLFIPMEGQPQMARGAMPKENMKEAINEILIGKK